MSKKDLITFKHYRNPMKMQKTMNQRTCYEASISVGSMSLLRVKTGHILTKDDCMEIYSGAPFKIVADGILGPILNSGKPFGKPDMVFRYSNIKTIEKGTFIKNNTIVFTLFDDTVYTVGLGKYRDIIVNRSLKFCRDWTCCRTGSRCELLSIGSRQTAAGLHSANSGGGSCCLHPFFHNYFIDYS